LKPRHELPDDPALPALAAIRAVGLARAIPTLALGDEPVELVLLGYTAGSRATLEARAGSRRFAVKAYASDPGPEAALYNAFHAAGLAGPSGVRVPPLLAWERPLRVLVIGWLEGPTASDLVKRGEGKRAGELAARWIKRAAELQVTLGPPLGAPDFLHRARHWAAGMSAADPVLGGAASVLTGLLGLTTPRRRRRPRAGLAGVMEGLWERAREWAADRRIAADPALRFAAAALPPRPTRPRAWESPPGLVHGTLYARHLLDVGDAPGIIDWQRYGQGPLELDAGTFLATVWRIGLKGEDLVAEARAAEEAFVARTAGVLDTCAVAWYRAAVLLRLASKCVRRRRDWLAHGHALLREAVRQTEAAC
jgi:Phosphotransferase enzyme family